MAWIESHQEVGRHPKTKKLARLLGISLPTAVGYLHYLWWWALDFAQDGTLDRYETDDIADAMQWDGDADELVTALVKSGYIDNTEDGLVLHDWGEYAGKLLERRAKDRARKRAAAEAAGVPQELHRKDEENDEAEDGTPSASFVTNQPTVPNPTNSTKQTVPNRTEPTEPTADKPAAVPACPFGEIMSLYNEICLSFPRLRCIEGTRKKAVAARWKQFGGSIDTFRELFETAEASDFLKGVNDRNWSATFDWLMNANNAAKVLEGNYSADKRDGFATRSSKGGRPNTMGVLAGIIAAEEGGADNDEG